MATKKEVKKPTKKQEGEVITDILEEYFMQNGVEMVKQTFMNGEKFIKEEISEVR